MKLKPGLNAQLTPNHRAEQRNSRKHGVEQSDEDELGVEQVRNNNHVIQQAAVWTSRQLLLYGSCQQAVININMALNR